MGWGGTAVLTAGAVLMAFGIDHPWPFASGIAVTATGVVWQAFAQPRVQEILRREQESAGRAVKRSLALRSILEAGVDALMDELSVDFTDARVSVYRYKNDHFILLTRRSGSPRLASRGRGRYPVGEGLIGKAWDKGEGIVLGLPDERAAWEARCVAEHGMEPRTVAGIAMQSQSLVGKRIDGRDARRTPVGLVVLESLKKRGVAGATLDELRNAAIYPLLEQVLIEAVLCLDEQDIDDFEGTQH